MAVLRAFCFSLIVLLCSALIVVHQSGATQSDMERTSSGSLVFSRSSSLVPETDRPKGQFACSDMHQSSEKVQRSSMAKPNDPLDTLQSVRFSDHSVYEHANPSSDAPVNRSAIAQRLIFDPISDFLNTEVAHVGVKYKNKSIKDSDVEPWPSEIPFLNLFISPFFDKEDTSHKSKALRRFEADVKQNPSLFKASQYEAAYCVDYAFFADPDDSVCPFINLTPEKFTVQDMSNYPIVPSNFFSAMKGLKDERGYYANTPTMNELVTCLYSDVHDRVFTTIHRVPILHELWINHWTVPCFFISIGVFMHYRSYEIAEIKKSDHPKMPWWPEILFLRFMRNARRWINRGSFVSTMLMRHFFRVTLPIVFFVAGNLFQAFVVQMAISYAKPDAAVFEVYKQFSAVVYTPEKFACYLMALVVAESVYSLRVYYDRRWFCLLMAVVYFIVRRFVRNLSKYYSIVSVIVAYFVIATIYSAGGPSKIILMVIVSLKVLWKHLTKSTARLSTDEAYVKKQLMLMYRHKKFIMAFVAFFGFSIYYVIRSLRVYYLDDSYSFAKDFDMYLVSNSPTTFLGIVRKVMNYSWIHLESDFRTSGFAVNKWPSMVADTAWDSATVAVVSNSTFLLFIEAGEIVADNWRICFNDEYNAFKGLQTERHVFTDLMIAESHRTAGTTELPSSVNLVDLWFANLLFYIIRSFEGLHAIFRMSILIPAIYIGIFYAVFVSKWNDAHSKGKPKTGKGLHANSLTKARKHILSLNEGTLPGVHQSVQEDYQRSVDDLTTVRESTEHENSARDTERSSTGTFGHQRPFRLTRYLQSGVPRPARSLQSWWRLKGAYWRFVRRHSHYCYPLASTLALFLFQHLMMQQLLYYYPKKTFGESALYLYGKIVPFDQLLVSLVVFLLASALSDMKPANMPYKLSLMWYFLIYFARRYFKNKILLWFDVLGKGVFWRNLGVLGLAAMASCLHMFRKDWLKSVQRAAEKNRARPQSKKQLPCQSTWSRFSAWCRRGLSKIASLRDYFDKSTSTTMRLCVWEAIFYGWLYWLVTHGKFVLAFMKYDFRHDLITTVVTWGSLFSVVDMQMIFPVFAMLAESLNMLNLQLGTSIMNDFDEVVAI